MFLRLITHQKLNQVIFKTRTLETETYIEDYLQEVFHKVSKGLYEIEPKKLPELNQVISSFKEHFLHFIGVAPPPFSFFVTSDPKFLPKTLLRPGKIYFPPKLKGEVLNAFKGVKTFYRIDPWYDVLELVLPSTVNEKLDLFYKDVFFAGKHSKFCFFCNTNWHTTSQCPALKDPSPRHTFNKTLEMNFLELSQTIWDGISRDNFSYDKLKYFYTRYFFLFPEFLKLLFTKGKSIDNWTQLNLTTEAPLISGSLGLGLDALIRGDIALAEKHFEETEGDCRAYIGQMFVNILKEDWNRALYFLESALSKADSSFVKTYLLFMKGYISEITGDEVNAIELYKRVFEIDRTCLPAFYRLSVLKYAREEEVIERTLSYFNHPYLLYWCYLEPFFIKEQKLIEEFLEKKLTEKRETATQRLKEAEDLYHKLKTVMTKKEREEYEEKLKKIRNDIYSGGVAVIEKASDKALDLTLELRAYTYNKIKNIRSELEEVKKEYELLAVFWKRYPYKGEDFVFGKELKSIADLLTRINKRLLKKDVSGILNVIMSELETVKKKLDRLKSLQEELNKKWIFRRRLADFLKNFTVIELFLVVLYVLSYFETFKGLGSFLDFPMFLVFSFLSLIICLVIAYFKNYE